MKSHRSTYGMPFERVGVAALLASAVAVCVTGMSGVQFSMVDRTERPRAIALFVDGASDPVPLPIEVIALARVLPDPRVPRIDSIAGITVPVSAPATSPRRERLAAALEGDTAAILAATLSGTAFGGAAPPRADTRGAAFVVPGDVWRKPGASAQPVVFTTPPLATVRDTRSMTRRFDQMGYSLEGVREGQDVPRLFLASLPRDLPSVDSVDNRKRLFIKALLPHILRANETVLDERARIERLAASRAGGDMPSAADQEWLESLAARYGEAADDFPALLRRHDVVPPSLALAQSIEESGWGTSRFALLGNALFGQRTFEPGDGIVPHRRASGEQHEVKSFDHLHESVLTYLNNLNRHTAYREFRRLREAMRGKDAPLDGTVLAGSLTRYSERGQEYVDTIRAIMRTNDLAAYDAARLQDPRRMRLVRESF